MLDPWLSCETSELYVISEYKRILDHAHHEENWWKTALLVAFIGL